MDGQLGTPLVFEGNFSQDKFLDLPADNWRLSAIEAPVGRSGIWRLRRALLVVLRVTRVSGSLPGR
jgi:hypothetical protein